MDMHYKVFLIDDHALFRKGLVKSLMTTQALKWLVKHHLALKA